MATYNESINLPASYVGATLIAKDTAGAELPAVFTEIGGGDYTATVTLPDTYAGYIYYYTEAGEYLCVSDYIDLATSLPQPLLELSEIKAYLKIDTDAEDSILEMLMYASQGDIENRIGQTSLADFYAKQTANLQNIIKVCVLQGIGNLYENRESETPLNLNKNRAFEALVTRLKFR